MEEFDAILIGTGSGLQIINALIQENPAMKVAVIDRDEPGGICLTRGCIPSKILLYSADVVRTLGRAAGAGVDVTMQGVRFKAVMDRMRRITGKDSEGIGNYLSNSPNIRYFRDTAEFVSPYTLKAGDATLHSGLIFLCAGSRPAVPPVKNLGDVGYLTSDTLLSRDTLPGSLAIIGGGYIAAEYGHFLAAMGSEVTILGRNPQFIPEEEPEVSEFARQELGRNITILTNHEVTMADIAPDGKKRLHAFDRDTGRQVEIRADEILVASGRAPNTDLLKPEAGGIITDPKGWIVVDDYLETSQKNVWAFGDAIGRAMFKHMANYEARVVYRNIRSGEKKMKADFSIVPHAVFIDPEIAGVGMKEAEAVAKYGKEHLLVGFGSYGDTAKGAAMGLEEEFAKILVHRDTLEVLGAHIVGPFASIIIQEVVSVMSGPSPNVQTIAGTIHIHPAMSEVIELACTSLMKPDVYHHLMEEHYGREIDMNEG
jgi:mycothione reductase